MNDTGVNNELRSIPIRIDTVVSIDESNSDSIDEDEDDCSQIGPSQTGLELVQNPNSLDRNRVPVPRNIGIELKVSPNGAGRRGVLEVNPSVPSDTFLNGPGALLSKYDFMHMIQEGVRLAVSQTARNNRVRVLKGAATEIYPPAERGVSSSSVPATPPRKTMKYLLHQYKPKNFLQMRRLSGISDDDFLASICDADLIGGYSESSGKSGSLFWYSADRKYLMKSISADESALLQRICASYLKYVWTHPHSLLCKFFAMYKITTTVAVPSYLRGPARPSRIRSERVQTTRFVIMNNVFYGSENVDLLEKFDLKGTTEDRYVKQVSGNEVLKDINFQNRWISLRENLSDCLNRVIQEDCEFLLRHGIMDYSLIVGIQPTTDPEVVRTLRQSAQEGSLETVTEAEKKKSIQQKLNIQLAAAKTAAKKAAHSVQKLLSPSTSVVHLSAVVPPAERPAAATSRLPSILECPPPAVFSTDEPVSSSQDQPVSSPTSPNASVQLPESDTLTRRLSATYTRAQRSSVFRSCDGGIVGIDETGQVPVIYYLGIIDILQQYTMNKKLAHFFKKFTIGCCHEIDTVAPPYYKARLVRYMAGRVKPVDEDTIDELVSTFSNKNSNNGHTN